MNTDRLAISVEEFGQKMNLSRTKAYELSRSEGFPTIKVGGRILIPLAQLEEWTAQQVEGNQPGGR